MTQTTIDPNKVQLAEKDIEDWLWENPQVVAVGYNHHVEQWIGRQVKLPSGVADLIGTCGHIVVVVEVKNVELTADALTQVCRYAADIEGMKTTWVVDDFEETDGGEAYEFLWIEKVVVFKGEPESRLQFEADALGISLQSFKVKLDLTVGAAWKWKDEYRKQISAQREEIARSGLFDGVREATIRHYELAKAQRAEFLRKREAEEDAIGGEE